MKSFHENYVRFKEETGWTDSDIIELTELTEEDIDDLEDESMPLEGAKLKDLYQFCTKLEVALHTVYSDNGMLVMKFKDQFDLYPIEYRKIITKRFLKMLAKYAGSEAMIKNAYLSKFPDSKLKITRLFTGNSAFDGDEIVELQEALEPLISKDMFYEKLIALSYKKIINYNFDKARRYWNLMYADIAKVIDGISASGVSNWGGTWYAPIRDQYASIVAEKLGNFTLEEFKTQFITNEILKTRTCSIKSIDVPGNLDAECKVKPKKQLENHSKIHKPRMNGTNGIKPLNEPATKPKHTSTQIDLSSNKYVDKMYNHLSDENKQKVNELITELFFFQLD